MASKPPVSAAAQRIQFYRGDLEAFGKDCLRILTKSLDEPLTPAEFNAPQRYLHQQIEKQKAETGRVRMLVPKGRQMGVSTYTAARFYARASLYKGTRVYILSHEQPTSSALFDMVARFQQHNPLRPSVGTSNIKQLVFDKLDSQYTVATAGTKAGGRGFTITHLHGSEAAMWPNAEDHFASVVQAVSDEPGSETILESTSAGPRGAFYERVQDAIRGIGDYRVTFLPWFMHPSYRRPLPDGFELSDDQDKFGVTEIEYAEMYGLSHEQMLWRRMKVAEIRDEEVFRREYPASITEAFEASAEGAFISPALVLKARKNPEKHGQGPLIIGVDPAGPGGDRFAVAWRRGHVVEKVEWRNKLDTVEAVTWLEDIVRRDQPAKMYVDAGGIGYAVISMLKSKGDKFPNIVNAVNFGSTSQAKTARPKMPGPKNRRAEMWMRSREWLELEEGVSIPDLDVLHSDATGPTLKPSLTNDILLESKDDMRKRKVASPDLWDAVALTFAEKAYIQSTGDAAPKTATETAKQWIHTTFGRASNSWQGY